MQFRQLRRSIGAVTAGPARKKKGVTAYVLPTGDRPAIGGPTCPAAGRRCARDRPPWTHLRASPNPSVNRAYLRQLTPAALTAGTSVSNIHLYRSSLPRRLQ